MKSATASSGLTVAERAIRWNSPQSGTSLSTPVIKRGTHLITGVERLVPLCGEFQRIALSATVRPLEAVADFIGGFVRRGDHYEKRPVAIVRGDQVKEFRILIRAPEEPSA